MVGGRAGGGKGGDRALGVWTVQVFCELLAPQLRLGLPGDSGSSGCPGLSWPGSV